MKLRCIFTIFVILLLPAMGIANLEIIVKPDHKWGDAPTSNIKELCENVALHFQEQLRDEHKVNGELTIVYQDQGPIAFYKSSFGGGPDEYKIGLTVTDLYWSQFSYQFGHEFCHIIENHDDLKNNPNSWFHEAICELATLWVIRRMSETWATRAPYPNWVSYRHALANYANDLMNRNDVQYSGTGAEWLAQWEDRMRNNHTDVFTYARVAQLSYKFLPIFEENPEAWNAVRQIPTSKGKMSEYMKGWYETVDSEDQKFVEAIAAEMGISVTTEVLSIDADVNNDGYVDIKDVLLVRSAMQNSILYDTDINDDGITNEIDLLIVKAKAIEVIAAAAPRKSKIKITTWGSMKRR